MANMTIALDPALLEAGREYAQKHGTSLNALVRILLERTVSEASDVWVDECLNLMDKKTPRPKKSGQGRTWRREDLYDV